MFFFAVKIFFFASKPSGINFFRHKLSQNYYFFYKNNIFKAQSKQNIFFCPCLRQNLFFPSNLPTEKKFPQKTIAPPPFKLNECSLNIIRTCNTSRHRRRQTVEHCTSDRSIPKNSCVTLSRSFRFINLSNNKTVLMVSNSVSYLSSTIISITFCNKIIILGTGQYLENTLKPS